VRGERLWDELMTMMNGSGLFFSHQHAEHFKSKKSSSLPLLLSSAATNAKKVMITPAIFFIVDFSTLVLTWRKKEKAGAMVGVLQLFSTNQKQSHNEQFSFSFFLL
jgi:hypothetical protein